MFPKISGGDWLVVEDGFDPARANFWETVLTVGNGYQGTRASLEEGHKGELLATYLNGVYDHHDSTVIDQVNVPGWIPLRVRVEGHILDVKTCEVLEHRRILDLQTGFLHRDTLFRDGEGRETRVTSLRFTSLADRHLCGIRLSVTAENHSARITVESALDAERYNLDRLPAWSEKPVFHPEVVWQKWARSRHLAVQAASVDAERAYVEVRTLDTGISIGTGTVLALPEGARFLGGARDYERVAQVAGIEARRGMPHVFEKFAAIATSRDMPAGDIRRDVLDRLDAARRRGMTACLEESAAAWRAKWDACDCVVAGDPQASLAARFSIYHLLIAANEEDPRANIGAKSLSGEGYKGHVFWDTEIFLLPFFIFTQPETARALLTYRYHTLPGALQNARENGFRGAQYAWESADTGRETTPKWTADGQNRIWTGEEEIHVTACVAYGILSYVTATGDREFLRDYGAEILYQTARYWASRLEWNAAGARFELTRVIGPDEFHEHVDNNTFTNRLAQWHLEQAVAVFEGLAAEGRPEHAALLERLELTREEVARWAGIAGRTYLPAVSEDGLIEQFEGYFGLEDVPITEWDQNRMPRYPAGHDHFSLNGTTLLKQPDVVMLTYLLPDAYPDAVKAANYAFYEKRTLHKSSLSPAVHAIMGIEVGDHATAELYFQRAAFVDLRDNQGNTCDGMHIASAGGTWQILVCGFGGFRVRGGRMSFKPWLPEGWDALRFRLQWRGMDLAVTVAGDECRFLLTAPPGTIETIEVRDRAHDLAAGEEVVVRL
ncbi:MAG: glycoside hydrolase family 65 protein [Rhodovulum sp.]|nr:glycoside hydrolase family 65 protein [Rhodovulum sp.]